MKKSSFTNCSGKSQTDYQWVASKISTMVDIYLGPFLILGLDFDLPDFEEDLLRSVIR